MKINPIPESQASITVKVEYEKLKLSLGSASVPIFFTYIAPFPEYLSYITGQIGENLQNPEFIKIVSDTSADFLPKIHNILKHLTNTAKWLERYQNSATFYNFNQDLNNIFVLNIKIAYIFVALREAVKGWAIAAKKLPDISQKFSQQQTEEISVDDFIFQKDLIKTADKTNVDDRIIRITKKNQAIAKSSPNPLEKQFLPEYLKLCSLDFKQYMKKDYFWTLRVYFEEMILANITHFPHLIFSPYNIIAKLTAKYDNFDHLLYLLSESFPTMAMQRLMFNGYIMP